MRESYGRAYCPESVLDADAERSLPDPERLLVHRAPQLLRDTNDNEDVNGDADDDDRCSDCNTNNVNLNVDLNGAAAAMAAAAAGASHSGASTPSATENERRSRSCNRRSRSPPTRPLVVHQQLQQHQQAVAQDFGATSAHGSTRLCSRQKTGIHNTYTNTQYTRSIHRTIKID